VALQLASYGIRNVRPLAEGFHGWRERGYPLVSIYEEKAVKTAAVKIAG
jgi:hypothetical protein